MRGLSINSNIMKEVLDKINRDRISAEHFYNNIEDKGWNFEGQEEYLISKVKIEFANPKFWYYFGKIFYEFFKKNKSQKNLLENALFCFNKPFEKNKKRGKTIICDSFQNPQDLFSLSYSEYLDFLNESLDYLFVIYKTPCFYEKFSIPGVIPKKPEVIERYEVIIRADYIDSVEKEKRLFVARLEKHRLIKELIKIFHKSKKITLSELAQKLNLKRTLLEDLLEELIINKKIEGKLKGELLTIKYIQEFEEESSIITSGKGLCSICKENIEERSIACSNCLSKFHKECFLNWIDTNNSCPVCQKKIDFT